MKKTVVLYLALPLILLLAPATPATAADQPVQVFIMAGQSNMVGHCKMQTLARIPLDERPEINQLSSLIFKEGQLLTPEEVAAWADAWASEMEIGRKIKNKEITGEAEIAKAKEQIEALKQKRYAMSGAMPEKFAVSEQVYITSIADNNRRSGPLSIGYGGSKDKIGPELGFGMAMAKKTDAPILIIKTSWGGKSLEYDFRPPSAGPYKLTEKQQNSDKKADIEKNVSHFYRQMTEKVHEALKNIGDYHPAYNAKAGYEIAGFVWFQGFNDQFEEQYRANYQSNMVDFVKDVRKEFKAPDMPFVIGVIGTNKTEEEVGKNAVALGQRAAAQDPSMKDNVVSVESYPFWDWSAQEVFDKGWVNNFREWAQVGSDRPYHYLGSGKFFVGFGNELAQQMDALIKKQ